MPSTTIISSGKTFWDSSETIREQMFASSLKTVMQTAALIHGKYSIEMRQAEEVVTIIKGHIHQEKKADLFTSELLIPKDFLEKDIQKVG